nr:T9SS type A sorting domain-containing protein [uncultured Fluviicola sp.]
MKKQALFLVLALLITFQIKSQCWISVTSKFSTSYGIKSDGTLWAWGYSSYGQIGDGTTNEQTSPIQIGTDTDWTFISSGFEFVVAKKSNGTYWGWGRNDHGALGDGTIIDKAVPTLLGNFNYTSFVTGGNHCLAIKPDGTLWAWGFNSYGQLGDGTTNQRLNPIQIGSATNWASVYSGDNFSFGIKTDGTLWAWGANQSGKLGNGNTTQQLTPIQIGTATDWASVSANYASAFGRKTNGTLWAWGFDIYGQFGNGTPTSSLVPVQSGTATDWADVSSGMSHTLALKTNGSLWVWGNNSSGQLGDGTSTDHSTPVQIGTATNWTKIVSGSNHSMVLNSDHVLMVAGYNVHGQVGNGTFTDVNSFTSLSGSAVIPQFTAIAPVCAGASVTLPPTSTNGIAGSWSPPFNSTASETYTFTPTTGCATTTTLPITINQVPVILSSAPATRCGTGTVVLGASANAGVLNWYDQPAAGTLLGTGTSFTTPGISSSTTYYVEAVNGSCTSARTAVTASVTTTATPSANSNQVFCNEGILGDISITGTSINWYDASSAGNLLPIGTPLVNGAVYYASQTVAACESGRIAVTVAINTTPAPSGTANQNFCQAATIGDLVVTGTDINWYDMAAAGTVLPTNTPIVTGTIYYASQTQNSCESSVRLAVTAIVTTVPAPGGSSVQDFCSGAAISDLVVAGTDVTWYNAATAGTILPANTLLIAGTVYYASQTVTNCESSVRLAVTATLDACLGIYDHSLENLIIYPNPATNQLTISSPMIIQQIEISTSAGQIVDHQVINSSENDLDISSFKPGVYLLEIRTNEGIKTIRFVKN